MFKFKCRFKWLIRADELRGMGVRREGSIGEEVK